MLLELIIDGAMDVGVGVDCRFLLIWYIVICLHVASIQPVFSSRGMTQLTRKLLTFVIYSCVIMCQCLLPFTSAISANVQHNLDLDDT